MPSVVARAHLELARHAVTAVGWMTWHGTRQLVSDLTVMRFMACPTPQFKLPAATSTPWQRRLERGPHWSRGQGGGNLTTPREEDGDQSKKGLGKRSFSCRGEREILGTRFDSLPTRGSGKEEVHRWSAGSGCVMRDGERRRQPMIAILGAKQLQGLKD
jgi:hypothetical protein